MAEPEYPYYDGELGIIYSREKCSFRIWAPTASAIKLLLYEREMDQKPAHIQELQKDIKGTWYTEITGDLAGITISIRYI